MWRKVNPHALFLGVSISEAIIENNRDISQKIRNIITIPSSTSTPQCLSKKKENTNFKRYMHPSVHSSTIAKIWKQPKCPPTDEWIKKMWYIL